VDIGETVRIGFVSQSRDALKETDTIYQAWWLRSRCHSALQAISEGLESFNVCSTDALHVLKKGHVDVGVGGR